MVSQAKLNHRRWSIWTIKVYHTQNGNANITLYLFRNTERKFCIRVKSKEELTNRIYRYFVEINEEPIVFHWKYNLDDIDVSEEIIVDTLPVKKSS